MRCLTLPALVDLHVHLREPGQTHKGDIAHESHAACCGGFGAILAMANTTPAIDRPERWLEQQERIAKSAHPAVQVYQCATMTLERAGREPVDAAALKRCGVLALSDDGATTSDAGVLREIAARAAEASLLLIDHCETAANDRRGELGLVERDILVAQESRCRFHLQHLSCAESVEMVRQARKDGIPVTGEVTPHHLAMTEAALVSWGANAKMSPPLRTEADRQALLAGVADDTLSVIATDHAPHAAAEKARPLELAPNGIIGLEAAFPVCYTLLVASGRMTLDALLERMSAAPAKILGIALPKREFRAEILDSPVPLDTSTWHSLSGNSPWQGFPVLAKCTFAD